LILNDTIFICPSFLVFLSGSSGKPLFLTNSLCTRGLKNRSLQAAPSTR